MAIDGGTPAGLRKRMVDDFRRGRIRVLVNVDVFSEGFDCPDVGFVQLARPTLSLAKYLQQVGRGLRKTGGKETCVLIDNVGLYRLFGIPTADRDWQAMFEGRLAGKGVPVTGSSGTVAMALARVEHEVVGQDCDLEVVVTHDGLFDILNDGTKGDIRLCVSEPLKAFKDRTAGLYGLRRGNLITVKPEYNDVYDVCDDYAAVKDGNGRVFVIDCNGNKVVEPHCCKKLRLLKGGVAFIVGKNGDDVYIDLKNGKTYHDKPTVVKYGSVEMLRTRHFICSRTKNGCLKIADTDECRFVRCGFYIKVRDYFSEARYRRLDEGYEWWNDGVKCVLENDYDDCYGFCGSLADGSIIVADEKGGYYHVEEGRGKRFVASENPESGADDFDAAVMKLKAEAYRKAAKAECDRQEEREKERRERLAILKDAIPFKSGLKWGLKLGGKVIVPPIYRSLQAPIGDFCAFEAGPYQWGVITLDGRVVVKAMYSKVEIENDGTARLTVIPGKIKTVKLEA